MSWTLTLDQFTHDLRITDGAFERIRGSDEVRQRIKVLLWHYFQEYFLNIPDGTPWYEDILGRTADAGVVDSILRQRILSTPGVLRINSLQLNYDGATRRMTPTVSVNVVSGPGEFSTLDFSTSFPVGG